MSDKRKVGRGTVARLIAELHKLPPDAEVVTSIHGWEGPELGPVTIIEPVRVVDQGPHVVLAVEGRAAYVLDTPG